MSLRSALIPVVVIACIIPRLTQSAELAGRGEASAQPLYPIVPYANYLTIPATASIHGLAGAFFRTDLSLMNLSYSTSARVSMNYVCATNCDGRPETTTTLLLAPRESRLIQDVVGQFFGSPETSGPVRLSWTTLYQPERNVYAVSRTYAVAAGGSYGTTVPALADADATSLAVFIGLAGDGQDFSAGFRSNAGIGYFLPAAGQYFPAEVTFSLYASDGAPLGTTTRTASTPFQITDIFAAAGAGAIRSQNASLVVTSSIPCFPYVTVVDNVTGDSQFLPFARDVPKP